MCSVHECSIVIGVGKAGRGEGGGGVDGWMGAGDDE